MIIVNLIDKDRVRGEDGMGDAAAVWRARLVLFIGFALMAGGLAGSVVRTFYFPISRMSLIVTSIFWMVLDCSDFEVYHSSLSGAVHLLRLRERFPECCSHVIGYRSLDIPEFRRRVRVQSLNLGGPFFQASFRISGACICFAVLYAFLPFFLHQSGI